MSKEDSIREIAEAMARDKARSNVPPMDRFFNAINQFGFSKYFTRIDKEKGEVDLVALREQIGVMSSQEQIIISFFVYVFTRENHFNFDYIEAVRSLDYHLVDIITDWGQDPYWP